MSYISRNARGALGAVLANLVFAFAAYLYMGYAAFELWKTIPVVLLFLINAKIHLSRLMRLLSGGYGEDEVFQELWKRLVGYKVLRNVYTGRGDIDLLVIGRSGVHVVEVKRLRGYVVAKRHSVRYGRKDLLRQLDRNEIFVERLLAREGFRPPVRGHLIVLGNIKGRNKRLARNVGELAKRIRRGRAIDEGTAVEIASLFRR